MHPSSESESEDNQMPESRKRRPSTILQEATENAVSFAALPENIASEKSDFPDNEELNKKKRVKESKPRAMPQWLPDEVRLFLRCRFATVTGHYVPRHLSVCCTVMTLVL